MAILTHLRPLLSTSKLSTTFQSTFSTALRFKTAALLGACVYQVIALTRKDVLGTGSGTVAGARLSRKRKAQYVREFVRDRAEEWWAVAVRGRDGVWVEARRDFKATRRAEKQKDRKIRWERKVKREQKMTLSERALRMWEEKNLTRKQTGYRVTFPWGKRSGK